MTILLDYYSLGSQPGMLDFPHIMNYRLTILLALSVIFLWFSKRVSQERIKLDFFFSGTIVMLHAAPDTQGRSLSLSQSYVCSGHTLVHFRIVGLIALQFYK